MINRALQEDRSLESDAGVKDTWEWVRDLGCLLNERGEIINLGVLALQEVTKTASENAPSRGLISQKVIYEMQQNVFMSHKGSGFWAFWLHTWKSCPQASGPHTPQGTSSYLHSTGDGNIETNAVLYPFTVKKKKILNTFPWVTGMTHLRFAFLAHATNSLPKGAFF